MAANPPSPSRLTPHALLLPSSFLLFALLFLLPLTLHPSAVPFNPHAEVTDLLVTHLPNAHYLRDSLARYGQLPLWNTQIMSGQPFAADPLAGLWYPPNLLLLILPLPFAFNLLFVLHLAWAGYGLFGFLRDEGLSTGAAIVGGIAFAGTPKLIAHIAAGHASLVFAVAWTPWLLRALHRVVRDGGGRRGAMAGAGLALIFLADVRWAFYAGGLGAVWWLAHLPRQRAVMIHNLRAALALALVFLLLIAGLALPLAEFLGLSRRAALTIAEAGEFSLPPQYLLGLLALDPNGFHEYLTYLGVSTVGLALFGVRRATAFWWTSALFAIAFALGANFFLFPVLFRLLPGLAFLRVPSRAWFIVALAAAVLAAHGASHAWTMFFSRFKSLPYVARIIPFVFLLIALAIFSDLLLASASLLVARPLPASTPAAEWLAAQPGLFRVYSPRYNLPQPDALQHAEGVDPLYLADYADFIARASGIPFSGYSVVVPAWVDDETQAMTATTAPDARLLGLLNVKYVATQFPLQTPGFALAQTFDDVRVYENAFARPRAWMDEGQAEILFWSPNRIVVRATGPGRLILSEIVYPGWQVWVDGQPANGETVEELLRGVSLSDGTHTVMFEFHPFSVYVGAGLTAMGLLVFVGILRYKPHPPAPSPDRKSAVQERGKTELPDSPLSRNVGFVSGEGGWGGEVTRREWRWAILFAVAVMVFTTVPYLVAVTSQTAEWRFGGFLIGTEDGNSYLAKMGQGARGAWLFTLPYTSEPQRGVFIYILLLVLGKLAGPSSEAQIVVYHLTRIVFGCALILISYRFLAEFLPRLAQRRLGIILVTFGGGLGWVLVLAGQAWWLDSFPIEFYSPEAFTFLMLYGFPHLLAARCLFLLGLLAHWRGRAGWAGLALFGVSLIQPLYVLVAWVLIGLHTLILWLQNRRDPHHREASLWDVLRITYHAFLTLLLSSPIVLYTVWILSIDPLLKQWNAQNILPSAHPAHYLLGYGLWLIPAALGMRVLWRRNRVLAGCIAGWAAVVPFLIYAPLTTQRRLIEGFQLPLVALTVLGLTVIGRRWRKWAVPLVTGLSLIATVLIWAGGLNAARTLAEPVFLPADQRAVFAWLGDNASPGEVALASFETGNFVPAYTPLVAYIGHGPESVFLAQKQPRVAAFYQSAIGDAERLRLLMDGRIKWVLFGPHERALGDFDPATASYLNWRFTSGAYSVYEVAP
jgi:hypothetical protein